MINMDADEKIGVLCDAGLLTEGQAEAWVLREEEGMTRRATGEKNQFCSDHCHVGGLVPGIVVYFSSSRIINRVETSLNAVLFRSNRVSVCFCGVHA